MMLSDTVGIVADDLTGANDTALQFYTAGADAGILTDRDCVAAGKNSAGVWAVSSESRNCGADEAVLRTEKAVKTLVENFSFDYYYKKIDSTLRGHIALETLKMLEILEYDAAVIMPAFPQEGRITVGGYHLLNGVPIGRTEIAMDPLSPIRESHIPSLLCTQLNDEQKKLIGTIDLKTVMNGAGPILIRLNELVKDGKKLIIVDSASLVDIEQTALAINKCDKKLLPAGTAAGAKVMAKFWLPEIEREREPLKIEKLPKFIVSGSAAQITAEQIEELEKSECGAYFIPLDMQNIINGDVIIDDIVSKLENNVTAVVHTSGLTANFDGFSDDSFNAELTKEKFTAMITDYLAELTEKVLSRVRVVLITLGGETSYKCCSAIRSGILKLLDEAAPAISLCSDINNRLIITKSGNLGDRRTLIDILDYLERHE